MPSGSAARRDARPSAVHPGMAGIRPVLRRRRAGIQVHGGQAPEPARRRRRRRRVARAIRRRPGRLPTPPGALAGQDYDALARHPERDAIPEALPWDRTRGRRTGSPRPRGISCPRRTRRHRPGRLPHTSAMAQPAQGRQRGQAAGGRRAAGRHGQGRRGGKKRVKGRQPAFFRPRPPGCTGPSPRSRGRCA